MKKQDLVKESIVIITAYYNNDLKPFFDCISDQVLWIGPRGNQELQGKDNIMKIWNSQENLLTFTMGNIEARTASTGSNNLEVLLEYTVYTHFPDGSMDEHHQRLHYSWGMHGKKKPEVCMIHISNITEENEAEEMKVYASSHEESHKDAASIPSFSKIYFRTVYGKGQNEVTYYFNSATVLYIESTDRSMHSCVHTLEGEYHSIEKLKYFEEKFGNALLRVHASYLVNPMYIRSIERFQVTLTNGTTLPVPEKKYTAFKQKLDEWNGKEHSD